MRQTQARLGAAATIVALGLSLSGAAHAQGKQPSAAAKQTARQLLVDCRAKLSANKLADALKDCQGAHAIMGVPSTGLELARVQEAMGHLVEAREVALEVTRFDNSAGNAAFDTAMTEAEALAQSLEPKIPSLVINVSGPPEGAEVTVKVDAETIPQAAVSLPYKVNPGEHTVVVSAPGFGQRQQKVQVAVGQTRAVDVALRPASAGGEDVVDPFGTPDEPRPRAKAAAGRSRCGRGSRAASGSSGSAPPWASGSASATRRRPSAATARTMPATTTTRPRKRKRCRRSGTARSGSPWPAA